MNDVRVYRASELGGCMKRQIAEKLGYEKMAVPSRMQEVFDAGTAAEDEVETILVNEGWVLDDAQKLVTIDVTPRVRIEGHIDWLGYYKIIECKSMSDGAYGDWVRMGWDTPGLIHKYKWQLSVYMNALELPGELVAYNRKTKDWHVTKVEEPFVTTGEIKARVLEMDRFVRLGELPVECDLPSYPCSVSYLHEVAYDPDNMEVEGIATSYAHVMVNEKVTKEAKGRLRKLLDEATGQESYESERLKVTYFDRSNPRGWDEAKMREAGLTPDDFKKDATKSKQVRVTLRDDDERGVENG